MVECTDEKTNGERKGRKEGRRTRDFFPFPLSPLSFPLPHAQFPPTLSLSLPPRFRPPSGETKTRPLPPTPAAAAAAAQRSRLRRRRRLQPSRLDFPLLPLTSSAGAKKFPRPPPPSSSSSRGGRKDGGGKQGRRRRRRLHGAGKKGGGALWTCAAAAEGGGGGRSPIRRQWGNLKQIYRSDRGKGRNPRYKCPQSTNVRL